MAYKELSTGDFVILKEVGDTIEGKFIELDKSKKYESSYILKVENDDGIKCAFVSNIVKELIEINSIEQGEKIKVIFQGLEQNKNKTAQYKTYNVLVDRD